MTDASATSTRLDAVEFDPSDKSGQKTDGLFEIGLVLAGAVSAGAYIAGALDYLVEALDRWEKIKADERIRNVAPDKKTVPDHDVVIRVITGASGGGMNGAIFASAVSRGFRPVKAATATAPESKNGTGNPFFDAWVNEIDMKHFLETADIDKYDEKTGKPQPLLSLLDCTVLKSIVDRILDGTTAGNETRLKAPPRPYVSDPLRIVLTTGNLRGMRYRLNMLSAAGSLAETGYGMRVHKDHVRFVLANPGGRSSHNPKTYPGEVDLAAPVSAGDPGWSSLAMTALASGAFPLGLRPRTLAVSSFTYSNRFAAGDSTTLEALGSVDMDPEKETTVSYLAVDGGTMNNEPIELSRCMLAGASAKNPREGTKAFRSVIVIDPFVEMPDLGPDSEFDADGKPLHLGKLLMALMSAWKMQSRFSAEELALSADPNTYSRSMIAPSRGYYREEEKNRPTHIACGVLGGFGGFLSRDFRVHDFLLGRRNCEKYLLDRFVLPCDNDLFKSWRSSRPDFVAKLEVSDPAKHGPSLRYAERAKLPKDHLPIIPLVDRLTGTLKHEDLPKWPTDKVDLDALIPQIARRAKGVYRRALRDLTGGGCLYWIARAYLAIPACIALCKIRSKARKTISEALKKAGL